LQEKYDERNHKQSMRFTSGGCAFNSASRTDTTNAWTHDCRLLVVCAKEDLRFGPITTILPRSANQSPQRCN
jgi:hypothetical protein